MICLVCGDNIEKYTSTQSFITHHVAKYHGLNAKEYYDQYARKDGDGVCKCGCGRPTKFVTFINGYRKWHSSQCYIQSSEFSDTIKNSFSVRDIDSESKKRKDTCIKKYGVEHISQLEETKQKVINTNISNCGHYTNLLTQDCYDARWKSLNDNKDTINIKRRESWTPEKIQITLRKRKQTCLEKYGVESVFQLDDVKKHTRQVNVDNGVWLEDGKFNEFQAYRQRVRYYTLLHKDELFENWDGLDYYTGDDLLLLNNDFDGKGYFKYQPTIDHKISIFYGFINNIDEKTISHISNLCVCSRSINAQKNILCEFEFKQKLIDRGVIHA